MTRAVLRFMNYTTTQDPTGELSWAALCVSGEDADCGANSGSKTDQDEVIRWMSEHCRDSGHDRFWRMFTDYAMVTRQE